MIKIALWLLLIVGLLAAAILLLMWARDTKQIDVGLFRQLVAGIVTGSFIAVISFGSAYLMHVVDARYREAKDKRDEERKVANIRLDSFAKISNEVSENRLTLEQERKREKPLMKLPLKTSAWDSGKYQTPVQTPMLIDGLKLLYDDIEKYNQSVEFINFKVREQNLTLNNATDELWRANKSIMDILFEKLKEFEKLTARELVLLGEKPHEEYEKRFGKFEDSGSISYFTKPKDA